MARLTATDVRNIVREELQRDYDFRSWMEQKENYSDEVKKVWSRLKSKKVPLTPIGSHDLMAVVEEVLDIYWEVVEEDMNRD